MKKLIALFAALALSSIPFANAETAVADVGVQTLDDGTVHFPDSAFYGNSTPNVHPTRFHLKVLARTALGWCPDMRWIYWEDAWYWHTFAGPYHHQVYHWEESLPDIPGTCFVVTGRYADIHNYEIWVFDGDEEEWIFLGISKCGISPWVLDVTEYVRNGCLTIMGVYGPEYNSHINCSFVNVLE